MSGNTVLHTLTAKQCAVCFTTYKKNLICFWKERNVLFDSIVIVNEWWGQYHIPAKQSSLMWKHKTSLCAMKPKSKTLPRKAKLTFFLDISGPILVEWKIDVKGWFQGTSSNLEYRGQKFFKYLSVRR